MKGPLLLLFLATCHAGLLPELQLQSGTVRGIREDLGKVDKYLGVPFAQPPIENLRWQPPLPPKKWSGVKNALTYSNTCYQPKNAWTKLSKPSEDCESPPPDPLFFSALSTVPSPQASI